KEDVDNLLHGSISFPNPTAVNGTENGWVISKVSQVAMLYLITGKKEYLDYTKKFLQKIIEYYRIRIDNNLNADWYVFPQISTLCAYDWIYDALTQDEREKIGKSLYQVMMDIAWHGEGLRPQRIRENTGGYNTGFYGTDALPWYIAITFYNDGIDDARCEKMFQKGLQLNMKMTQFRSELIGKNGGGSTGCVGYALGAYPVADFNFIRSYRAATGIDMSQKLDYVLGYLNFIDWNRLPGNREFGFGDSYHYDCLLPEKEINYHLREIATLYGSSPNVQRLLGLFNKKNYTERLPFMPFLQKYPQGTPGASSSGKGAMYFDGTGEVIMRSGTGADDTYALFVSGGRTSYHKHFDNNHFTIYKKGYRALDTGTRPEPGWHLSHYYARTVAHNCVTIRMPNEKMPEYWGGGASTENKFEPIPNDGGQNNILGSVLKEKRITDDYVYLASDATKSYNSQKASLVVREFIYFYPDLFVVFDRVTSTDKNYPKTWLIHTINEPVMKGSREFSETSDGGKMICRTLFPANATLTKIGGSGKDFWSDGRNWPLPKLTPQDYGYNMNLPPANHPQLGHWRIEVSPQTASKEDLFMHIIQVGDTALSDLPRTETFENTAQIGVRFTYQGKRYILTFDKTKSYGCQIEKK
ncbi:heparinase II/III family protein, partial [uncultured Capnocytophaga sp.]|uniref:heparinase II/III domain-containing protein n=1 Tax=uncultured Capnocytophaga sp. TaxID=159273 RepID=UPI00259599A7